MLNLYLWTTPNGYKPLIFMYEAEQEFVPHLINIRKQQQFSPEFLAISPNNKIPALVDSSTMGGDQPIVMFESGAILLYLAEKLGVGLGDSIVDRVSVYQWLFWQVGGLGPMSGQYHHFTVFADQDVPYAVERYMIETKRLYGVLENQLSQNEYVAGNFFSIADIAIYPWARYDREMLLCAALYPNLISWLERLDKRPSIMKAYQQKFKET